MGRPFEAMLYWCAHLVPIGGPSVNCRPHSFEVHVLGRIIIIIIIIIILLCRLVFLDGTHTGPVVYSSPPFKCNYYDIDTKPWLECIVLLCVTMSHDT